MWANHEEIPDKFQMKNVLLQKKKRVLTIFENISVTEDKKDFAEMFQIKCS